MSFTYLDHSSTTPVHPEVRAALEPYFSGSFGNPSSLYDLGQDAKKAVDKARLQVATLIGATAEEMIFTASGAEANNLAICGLALAHQKKGRRIIVSHIEHHSVLNAARRLERQHDFEVSFLPVNSYGQVEPERLARAVDQETCLVSIMLANPEIGTVQNLSELIPIAKARGALFHTDAVAAAGFVPISVEDLDVDALTLSGHQFYGPKGSAALFLRRGLRLMPLVVGGTQEDGRRAGTENVPAIVGMGKAAELVSRWFPESTARLESLRDQLIRGLGERLEDIYLTGHPQQRLPHHASFCVDFVEGEALLFSLALEGIYVGAGSACISQAFTASPVLLALGIPAQRAQGAVVFSLGHGTSPADIERVLDTFPALVKRLRSISPLSQQKSLCTTG